MDEEKRIIEAFRRREKLDINRRYSWFDAANMFAAHRLEQNVMAILRQCSILDLRDRRLLEVGCGGGSQLRNFIKYGLQAKNAFGIDLIEERINSCRSIHPEINLLCGNARTLPFEDNYFDLVVQFVAFSSVLEQATRKYMAAEMERVVKPDGLIIWYDFIFRKPGNIDVRGIRRKEIEELFPRSVISTRRVTLAPPLNRLVAPRFPILALLLEKIPPLKTFQLAAIRRREETP